MKVKIDVEAKENDSSKIDCYKISFQLAGDIEVAKKLSESVLMRRRIMQK